MRFAEKLSYYRERAKLNKTELANKLNCSSGYIINLESGRQKAPTFQRLKQIAEILQLSKQEIRELMAAAAEERISKNDLLLLKNNLPIDKHLSSEIIEALQDPVAIKALIITHKSTQDIKHAIKALLESFPNLAQEKRQAILALCK